MLTTNGLCGRRILVVEDEYLIAMDVCYALEQRGVTVIGPLPSVVDAMDVLAQISPLDAAVLDINLPGGRVYPLAEALSACGVPYVFATGYSADAIPEQFRQVPRCEKPVYICSMLDLLEQQITRSDSKAQP
jgi:CheY-like chemotaxis protein